MKYLYLLIIICSILTPNFSQAQIASLKLEIKPTNPSEQDSISFLYETVISTNSYFLDESYTIIGKNINIELCYLYNRATSGFDHKDSIDAGTFSHGKYKVKLQAFLSTDSACLNRIDSNTVVDSFTVSSAVSIKENQWVEQLKVFPNPAKDQLNIHALDKNLTIQELKLKDLQGKDIKFDMIHIEPSIKRINLNGLTSGIYFLEIRSNKGSTVKQVEFLKH